MSDKEMVVLCVVGVGFLIFTFVTMKYFWPNRIFGILYQIARILVVAGSWSSMEIDDERFALCIGLAAVEFFIILNMIGVNGVEDTRHLVEKVTQSFIPGALEGEGETITSVITTMEGDSSLGNFLKSLAWAFVGAVVFAVAAYFLISHKATLGGIALIALSVIRIVLFVLTIIRR